MSADMAGSGSALVASRQPGDLVFLHFAPADGSGCDPQRFAEQAYAPMASFLVEHDCVLLTERIFGDAAAAASVLRARQALLAGARARATTSPTFVEGRPCHGSGIAGLQAVAARPAAGGRSRAVSLGDAVCGQLVEAQDAFFLSLCDVGQLIRTGAPLAPEEEARRIFVATEDALSDCGWSFRDVRRTWFYLEHILGWYAEFNRTRNAAFRRMGLFGGQPLPLIPSSTGIEGRNAAGGACAMDLLATAARSGRRHEIERLVHARQNEATEYGSSFARGLAVRLASASYVFVSGTASIDEHGATVHVGDFARQVHCTFDAVESVLAAGGAALRDVCQGTAFLKRAADLDAYNRVARERGFAGLPIVCTLADVCRDDLLFEMDAAAITS